MISVLLAATSARSCSGRAYRAPTAPSPTEPQSGRTAVGTDRLATDERVTVDYATGGEHAVDELRVVHAPSKSVVATDALADPVRDFDGWAK
jgi:hypothetical protein